MMRRFLKFDPTTGACVGTTTLLPNETYHRGDLTLIESDADPTEVALDLETGEVIPRPFDAERARALKWREVKAWREAAKAAGVTYNGAVFDSDQASLTNVIGAAVLAQVDPTASWDWTAADNSVVTLTAADVIALGAAIAAHVDACHQRSRVLRAAIDAATTQAELDALQWDESP